MKPKIIASIAGPSGSGKTTLTERLLIEHEIGVPQHVTTRNPRADDKPNFYKHCSLPKFLNIEKQKEFLIGSNDGIRGYGVLKQDCETTFKSYDTLLINSSYKDIYQLQKSTISVRLIVLTFQDIEKGIYERIVNSSRNHNQNDINYRVKSALEDYEKYFEEVAKFAKAIIFTDLHDKEETYEEAEGILGFIPNVRKRVQ